MVYLIDNHASLPYHNPRSQVPTWNNPAPLSYSSLVPQSSGQYFHAQAEDILQMSAAQFAFMRNQMAQMDQKMDSEFGADTAGPEMYNDDTPGDEMSATTRSQSLSAGFNRLTIEERAFSSSRSAVIHGSSSTAVKGDYTEVDDNFYQINLDSHKKANNIIINSFGEGEQDNIGV
jgi:hypothetical protein